MVKVLAAAAAAAWGIQACCFRICTTCRGDPLSKSLQGTGARRAAPQPRQVAMRPTDGWLRLGGCVEQQRLQYDGLGRGGGLRQAVTNPRSNCGVRGYNGAEGSHKGNNGDNNLEGKRLRQLRARRHCFEGDVLMATLRPGREWSVNDKEKLADWIQRSRRQEARRSRGWPAGRGLQLMRRLLSRSVEMMRLARVYVNGRKRQGKVLEIKKPTCRPEIRRGEK